ncbi:MAG: dihydroorotate dehydrogenase electron transfer subunit, partial [bacterium]
MYQVVAEVLSNKKITLNFFKIILDAPKICQNAHPGQFVHIKVTGGSTFLLRRPFSIHNTEDGKLEILYRVVGKGTDLLSRKEKSEKVDLLGPLGQGFKLKEKFRTIVLVAGGIGVAPLHFLAKRLLSHDLKISDQESLKIRRPKVTLLLGAETKKQILCYQDFKNLGAAVKIATEDGSWGYKGLVSDFLAETLLRCSKLDSIFACGPVAMLKKIAKLSRKY